MQACQSAMCRADKTRWAVRGRVFVFLSVRTFFECKFVVLVICIIYERYTNVSPPNSCAIDSCLPMLLKVNIQEALLQFGVLLYGHGNDDVPMLN